MSALGERSETSGESRITLELNVLDRTDQSQKPQGMTQGCIATVDSLFDGEHHAIEPVLSRRKVDMKTLSILAGIGSILAANICFAAGLDSAQQEKLDARLKEVVSWAAEPALVNTVKHQNQNKSAEMVAMTQEKWALNSPLDLFIRSFTKNAAAEVLKAKRTEAVTEAFVSDADGTKVAFLAKPTNWNHKGKPKHDLPMSGKPWQGPVETDESTGFMQIQVAVPVLDGGKPIGSLVVGFNIAKL